MFYIKKMSKNDNDCENNLYLERFHKIFEHRHANVNFTLVEAEAIRSAREAKLEDLGTLLGFFGHGNLKEKGE